MHISKAKDMKKDLEVAIMVQIRQYEKLTGLRITKAEMMNLVDTRFFSTQVFMPPKAKKKDA